MPVGTVIFTQVDKLSPLIPRLFGSYVTDCSILKIIGPEVMIGSEGFTWRSGATRVKIWTSY